MDTDTHSKSFDKNNTIVLPYFGQISKTIQSMCKRCEVTYVGQTGRLLNTRVEKHKKNLGPKCNYHNVLSDDRNEYADHDFD